MRQTRGYDWAAIASPHDGRELGGMVVIERHDDGTTTINFAGMLPTRGRELRFVPRETAEAPGA
jgi:hypothetical protein